MVMGIKRFTEVALKFGLFFFSLKWNVHVEYTVLEKVSKFKWELKIEFIFFYENLVFI